MKNQSPYGEFNSDDIRRYLEGKMSSQEMHRIEKAALDDPFLADAMEGFQMTPSINIKDDIEELQSRLAEKTRESEKAPFAWWKFAAILILVLGATTTAWWLNKPGIESATLAKNETSILNSLADSSVKQKPTTSITDTGNREESQADRIESTAPSGPASGRETTGSAGASIAKDDQFKKDESMATLNEEKASKRSISDVKAIPAQREIVAATEQPEVAKASPAPDKDDKSRDMNMAKQQKSVSAAPAPQNASTPTYYFRGLVTDEQNKPVPYASIWINQSKIGTYSDVHGRFSMVASDSVLTTDIASVGYSNKKITLFARSQSTIVKMEPSTSTLSEVVITKSGKSKETEETDSADNVGRQSSHPFAEPTDGWSLFEIYIKNNLRIPSSSGAGAIKGTVVVSFYVDPVNGRLSDLRIEKSLGIPYDKEAIRVLKEGPTWDIFNSDSRLRASYTVIY